MPTLKAPGGAAIKDSEGNEIMEGALVADELFGQGFARGVIACETGGGFNVLVEWRVKRDSAGMLKPESRGARHMTRVAGNATTLRFHTGAAFESGEAHRRQGVNDQDAARLNEDNGHGMGSPARCWGGQSAAARSCWCCCWC
jgi:hypothetical protein|eukprot:6661405-Prymnesium_polylepis.1